MTETREAMIKRMRMRSMRRGIKEMDLILSAFADAHLAGMSDAELALYDALLAENDHDIYGWIGGQFAVPDSYAGLIAQVTKGAHGVTRPA
ncbi:antitoxin CptB [Yoonia tamlensis]|uniref:FAD assembly factor SdhE n=1 Tax=Yoonia tamlensis TaxID=390270 RepID=A0A1I6FY03_9RHOB|nr:succinate dehydrogenase assembly factor 2 [Yoonia tamlensis]SFR34832.1 antitoxin CptB [Yoonia tamlensis]